MGAHTVRAHAAGLPFAIAALAFVAAGSAAAQCVGPTQRFGPVLTSNPSADLSAFRLTPRGALGETLTVQNTGEYLAQLETWRRGEGLAPSLRPDAGFAVDDDFKPIIQDSDLIRERFRDWAAISLAGNDYLEALRNDAFISRVVGHDDGVPIELLPGSSLRPPPLNVPVDAFPGARPITIDAQDSVVAIADGAAGLCNGVHIGRGRFLTNLHCALDTSPRRVLLGNVAWNPNSNKLEGELSCSARRVWPESTASAQIDVAVIAISQNGALPMEFSVSRFNAAAFRPGSHNVWSETTPPALISIQIYPTYAPGTTRLRHRVEDGRWANSKCQAYERAPSSTLAPNFCLPSSTIAAIQNNGRGHGCDTIPGSSGSPLFVENAGQLELVGIHRMGAGPGENETVDPTNQNWNCAIPSSWFASEIGFQ